MLGQTLGSYVVDRELGRGGMGAVYLARHTLLGRMAAIKVLLPELSKQQETVQRFFNEARAATAIKHPGIVEIYDFGFAADGSAYIVMEHLAGESLKTRLARGTLDADRALAITRQVAAALAAAHRAGIVHRDLKPDNVYLVPDEETAIGERVKLLDFGIAKLASTPGEEGLARTSTGAIMGTPYYMSPEQCRGAGGVDFRSDFYSLGCMLYEMLCGQVPFRGAGVGDIIASHLMMPVPPPRTLAPAIPPPVEAFVLRLLAKKPEERPVSADAIAQEIVALSGRPSRPESAAPVVSVPPEPPPVAALGASTTLGGAAGERTESVPRRRSRLPIFLGVGAIAVAGIVVAIVATSSGSSSAPAAGAVIVVPDAAPAAPAPPAIDQATAAADRDDWAAASKLAHAVLATDAASPAAQAIVDAAEVRGKLDDNQPDAALAAFLALPDSSPYRAKLAQQLEAGKDEIFEQLADDVLDLITKGDCGGASAIVDHVDKMWHDQSGVLSERVKRCFNGDRGGPPPTRLTPAQMISLMRAQISKSAKQQCFTDWCYECDTADLVVRVSPKGNASASLDDYDHDLDACFEKLVKSVHFPATDKGGAAYVQFNNPREP